MDLPFRSMMRLAGVACAAIAASSPTATIRSPAMAIAWAIEKLASTVMTLAFLRMRSAGRAVENGSAGGGGADGDVCAVVGRAAPKVNAVLAVTFRKSRRGKRSSVIRPSLAPSCVGVLVGSRLARLGGGGNDRRGSFTSKHGRRVSRSLLSISRQEPEFGSLSSKVKSPFGSSADVGDPYETTHEEPFQ
jgi:hypothetical protein